MRYFTSVSALLVLCLFAAAGASPVFAHNVGDLVVVIKATEMKVDESVVRMTGRGSLFAVQAIDGNWLWPAFGKPGWINQRDVVPVGQAAQIFADAIQKDPKDIEAYIARASI